MRFIRSAAVLTLAGAATLVASAGPAAPAFAQGSTVIVTPSTVAPGGSVMFTITCDSPTARAATLYGAPLGLPAHAMNPTSQPGEFIVTVNLPATISPGTYTPSLGCDDGTMRTALLTVSKTPITPISPVVIRVTPSVVAPGATVTVTATCGIGIGTISAELDAAALGQPPIQMQQSAPGRFFATLNVPTSTNPGEYSLFVVCAPTESSGTASLLVNPFTPPPNGSPMTGDGTTLSAMGGPFTTAGFALLAAGGLTVGAGLIWKRRRAGAGS